MDGTDVGPGTVLGLLVLLLVYFVPTLIAGLTHKMNFRAILVLNLLLGWTVVGWIIALVWALTKDTGNK